MAGFCQARKLPNVVGRVDYISNPKRQENIIDYHNTADLDFWKLLGSENQKRHKPQIQPKVYFKDDVKKVKYVQTKCCEAREFILALPQDCDWSAEEIATWFKSEYGVECAVALHWKEEKQNYHAHIIYSERELLAEPTITKRAYYYDSRGVKCKKADAVKVVPKGTTFYFSDKNAAFKSKEFTQEFKSTVLHRFLALPEFDKERHFSQQKNLKTSTMLT